MLNKWESSLQSKYICQMTNVTFVCLCSGITLGKKKRLITSDTRNIRSYSLKATQTNWRKWRAENKKQEMLKNVKSLVSLVACKNLQGVNAENKQSFHRNTHQGKNRCTKVRTFLMLEYIRQWKSCPRKVLQDLLKSIYGGLGVGKENKTNKWIKDKSEL